MKILTSIFNGFAVLIIFSSICFAQVNSDSTSLKINLSIDSGYLVLNDDFSNCIEIQNGDVINIPEGYNKIRFVGKYFYDSITGLNLSKGAKRELKLNSRPFNSKYKDANKSSYARCFWDTNVFIFSDEDSKISVNGEPVGEHQVRLKLDGDIYRTTAEFNDITVGTILRVDEGINIVRNYARPSRGEVYKKVLVPGYAQIAKRQYLKSSIIISSIAVFGASALIFENKIVSGNTDYNNLSIKYEEATDPNEIINIIAQSEAKMDQIHKYEKARKISLIGLVAVYGINIIDGFIPPKTGFRSTKFEFNPFIDFDKNLVPTATLKVSIK